MISFQVLAAVNHGFPNFSRLRLVGFSMLARRYSTVSIDFWKGFIFVAGKSFVPTDWPKLWHYSLRDDRVQYGARFVRLVHVPEKTCRVPMASKVANALSWNLLTHCATSRFTDSCNLLLSVVRPLACGFAVIDWRVFSLYLSGSV